MISGAVIRKAQLRHNVSIVGVIALRIVRSRTITNSIRRSAGNREASHHGDQDNDQVFSKHVITPLTSESRVEALPCAFDANSPADEQQQSQARSSVDTRVSFKCVENDFVQHLNRTIAYGAVAGAVGLVYAAGYEVRAFTLREVTVPVLPVGERPLRVLHLSDLHMTPTQGVKQRWLRSLADLRPDLVVNTGDNLAHPDVLKPLLESLGPLKDVPGVFVFGSNDYFAPSLRNPVRYLLPDDGRRHTTGPQLPFEDLRSRFTQSGWVDLNNRRGELEVNGLRIAFAGVDDPHLEYDDLASVSGPAGPADLRIGVTHAPYLRVLDQFASEGYELIMAGHTHGGQLRVPGIGALVTNCDIEPARSRGLHRHPAASTPVTPHSSWLHVSAGAGTSPYAPVRFCCRPEATLLTLTSPI